MLYSGEMARDMARRLPLAGLEASHSGDRTPDAHRLQRPNLGPIHVALVRPPLRIPRSSYSTLACPPLGLAYLAAALQEAKREVSIIDAVAMAPEHRFPTGNPRFYGHGLDGPGIAARIPAGTTLIGVSCMFSESWPLVRQVLADLRRSFPDVPIVVGGEHATALPALTLRDSEADLVVLGEGEETIVELVDALSRGRQLATVPGLAYLSGGEVHQTARRSRIRALDALPRPAWQLVPIDAYLDRGLAYGIGRARTMPLLATRGCPYQCTFCSSPMMWTTRWSARAVGEVLDEMEWAVERWRVTHFDFYDLTAILRRDWILEFCDGIARRGLDLRLQIPSGTRSEALDSATLIALYRSGVRHLVYAPESGSPSLLRRIKKKIRLDNMLRSMESAVAVGMTVKCNLMMGFPDETHDEALETLNFCRTLARIGVQDINVGPFCPYPGSELYDEIEARQPLSTEGDAYFDMLAAYSDLAAEVSWSQNLDARTLSRLRSRIFIEFYLRSFAKQPRRLLEFPRNVWSGKHQTRLDRAVADIAARIHEKYITAPLHALRRDRDRPSDP